MTPYKCKTAEVLNNEISTLQELHNCELGALRDIVNERHTLYGERAIANGTAVAAALAAQKEASQKTENYQKDYNVQHNDLMRKMDHQAEAFVSRSEYFASHKDISAQLDKEGIQRQIDKDAVLKRLAELQTELVKRIDSEAVFRMTDREAVMKEIAALREYNSRGFGEKTAQEEDRTQQNWSVGIVITLAVAIGGWLFTAIAFFMHFAPVVR